MLTCKFTTKKNASPNAGKLMLTVKWNCHCIVHYDLLQPVSTMADEVDVMQTQSQKCFHSKASSNSKLQRNCLLCDNELVVAYEIYW